MERDIKKGVHHGDRTELADKRNTTTEKLIRLAISATPQGPIMSEKEAFGRKHRIHASKRAALCRGGRQKTPRALWQWGGE